ncbi:MAG: hypothetical protein V3W34_03260 [Phycisphaerae bacterium]
MILVEMRRTSVYYLAAAMVGFLLCAGCRKKTDSPPAATPAPASKPARKSVDKPGKKSEARPAKKSADRPARKAQTAPAKEQAHEPVKKPATEPAVKPAQDAAKTTRKKRAKQSAKDPTKKPGGKRQREPAKKPPQEPAVKPATELPKKPVVEPAQDPTKDKELDLADRLLAAPEAVEIGGQTLTLETYLWRDFMPISPPDGKPLIATVTVVAKGATALPAGVSAVRMWVVNGRDVWEGKFSQDAAPPQPGRLERTAREGPKWGPGIDVEVVVELTDDEGNTHLLRAAKQKIDRTS